MLGVSGGLALAGAGATINVLRQVTAGRMEAGLPIVAWGDSLTQGGYPALAGALFSPPRAIVNKGIGGQGSYAIAARQGARPINVSLAGDMIPALETRTWSWDFQNSGQGWSAMTGAHIAVVDGQLKATVSSTIQGMQHHLGDTIPNGRAFTVEFDLSLSAGLTVRVSGLDGGVFAANDGAGTAGVNMTTSGHHKVKLYSGTAAKPSMTELCFCSIGTITGEFSIDNIVLTLPDTNEAVAVLSRNPNILTQGAIFAGAAKGSLAGVHGVMNTDSAGNWTFTRDSEGPSVPCPPDSRFILDDVEAYRNHTVWIWAGNNGVANAAGAAAAMSDIAAMIAYNGHSRYLVVSVLTSSAFAPERIAVLQQMNTDLASTYGPRFVDAYAKLRTAGNGSAEDNADIAAGFVPRSLRTDSIHLNNAGNAVVAQAMYDASLARAW